MDCQCVCNDIALSVGGHKFVELVAITTIGPYESRRHAHDPMLSIDMNVNIEFVLQNQRYCPTYLDTLECIVYVVLDINDS
jgi:hypothetical protein